MKMLERKFHLIKILFRLFFLNPTLFLRRLFLEAKLRIVSFPESPAVKNINGVNFTFYFKEASNRKRMYLGMCEMGVVHSMKTLLKKGDTFLDVGANIGHLTAIGAGLVGTEGQVHGFEPVPRCAERLRQLATANPDFRIIVNEVAVGDKKGTLPLFISKKSMGQSTAVPHSLKDEDVKETLQVPIIRLEDYIQEKKLNQIKLIKIDVEGFEFAVLEGLGNVLSGEYRPFIICEVVPGAYPLLGTSLAELFLYMEKLSYYPFYVVNPYRRLSHGVISKEKSMNVLFKPQEHEKDILD